MPDRDESAVKALLESAGLPYYPGITPLPTKLTGMGVDVANSEHGDRACKVRFRDNVWDKPQAFNCPDANKLGAEVTREARMEGLESNRVGVDAIGVGAGTVNEARRLKFTVQALYAGGKPMAMVEKTEDGRTIEWSPDVNLFENLRGQMLWQAREDLRLNRVDGPEDPELWQELTAVTFEDENKVVKVAPKDEIKKLLGRSPDKADAWVMGNWVRKRAVLVEKELPHKIAHRARPIVVKDGHYVKPDPDPKTVEELVERMASARARKGVVPTFTQRVPRSW